MITDRIQLAGLEAYFRNPAVSGDINLGSLSPIRIRTTPRNKGSQLEISGMQIMLQHGDLSPHFGFQFGSGGSPAPVFKITFMKEMFAGLFADPFRHRVHNIAGYVDFNEGTLENGRVLDIDGIPTIVSSGKEECIWISREYTLPDPVSIAAIAWELASSKLVSPGSFRYSLTIEPKDAGGNAIAPITTGSGLINAAHPRAIDGLNTANVKSFRIIFKAKVNLDSALNERHLPSRDETMGRPLLRAVNILEPVNSIYDIHSLTEMQQLSSDFIMFENPGPEIKKIISQLNLSAVIVHSENQVIANNDIYDPGSKYEFIQFELLNKFDVVQAKLTADKLIRANG